MIFRVLSCLFAVSVMFPLQAFTIRNNQSRSVTVIAPDKLNEPIILEGCDSKDSEIYFHLDELPKALKIIDKDGISIQVDLSKCENIEDVNLLVLVISEISTTEALGLSYCYFCYP